MSLLPADDSVTILIVDDTPENLALMGELLRPHYRVRVANSGERALRAVQIQPRPDLVLLDIMMPDMDGHQVLQALRNSADSAELPVIFVTAMDADDDEAVGLSLGAVDYITKPIRPAILLARVRAQLDLKRARDLLRDHNGVLEREVARRMRENEKIKEVSLQALALLAEKRDNETGNHLSRTRAYVEALARHLQRHPRFQSELSDNQCRMITAAAPLHDIGKVGIPDAILHKPGRLDPDEQAIMRQHAAIGGDAIATAMARVASDLSGQTADEATESSLAFLEIARQVVVSHHERWDGTGYPLGLAGDAIPLPGRLMALADVYDALCSRRVYKDAFELEEVDRLIEAGRGSHFDPDVVDAYLELHDEFRRIALKFADHPS